jgi:endonuclease-8
VPEGHTIHRIARDQSRLLAGRKLGITSPQGRFTTGAADLDGRLLIGIDAYGKHLLYRFEHAPALHVHLGLFGRFFRHAPPAAAPRDTTRVRFACDTAVIDLVGPNQCELLGDDARAALIARIGPDVLRDDADAERAWDRIRRSRAPIGLLIMDQSVLAGVGNIYRTELLWRAGINPNTPGRAIPRTLFDTLWLDACRLLRLGVKHNRIITVDLDRTDRPASRLRYRERTNIFAHAVCPRCATEVRKIVLAGRRAYVCERCQPATV